MKRFKNILLVCEQGGVHVEVIGRAIWLAKANDAQITLVDVVDASPGELASMFAELPGSRAQDLEHEVLAFHRERLAKVAAPIKSEGLTTSEVVLQGVPFVEVIRKVLRDGHDLVMKGASGETEGRSLFFGSIDLHLLRKCPCPVWIMKKGHRQRYARILAAVDPDQPGEEHADLNKLILDLATSLSTVDGSELHLVNVWRLYGEDTLRNSGFARISRTELDQLVERKRAQNQRKLEAILRDYPEEGPKRQLHVVKGAAREVIPELAEKKRVELIVMGTVGRTGIRGLIIGNTAEAILNQVECSVLAVKPPGFETPVKLDTPEIGN